ncbi:hypothetical protein [Candidatus Nitrosocosmicus arcticus]|uniref:Uncharacterized protein n=1 Tax=Candidatus Nitrosocosmicus arcticus TaxID=2035267 RepID=A0A557SZH5_9ARCH|nr:hypothetical protein [Candidatus Nitrosocosmicus arcticus]TVP41996.1 hypothetical protein NARC_10402 [Candidatus Nitrosocosmicus arcticus]
MVQFDQLFWQKESLFIKVNKTCNYPLAMGGPDNVLEPISKLVAWSDDGGLINGFRHN